MPDEASQPAPEEGQPLEELQPEAPVLRAIADAATRLADDWPHVEQDGGVRWCAVALAEQVTVLLRGDHRRALQLANQINEAVDAAVGLLWGAS